ncbi:MAG: tetratricopeptide repeat protein [Acidobacteriota bacterium]
MPRTAVLCLALVLSFAPAALASEAILQGKVVDTGGKPLEGVKILVADKSSGRTFKGKTNDEGTYYIRGIVAADYEVSFDKDGFTSHVWSGHLTPGKAETVDVTLQARSAGGGASEEQNAAAAELGKDFTAGVEKFNAKDYDGAIALFTKVTQSKPDLPDAYYNIGLCYQKKKDFAQAATWLQKAIDKKPDHAGAYFNLAFAFCAQGKSNEGVAAAKRTVELEPSAETAYNAGALLKNFNQNDDAMAMFEKATSLDPKYADAYREIGYLSLAKNDGPKAKTSLQKYLELAPTGADAGDVKAALDALP